VTKYEPPVPQDMSAKRALPFGIPETDQERWENLDGYIPFGERCYVTLKIDGQSWSCYYKIDTKEFGITGRTLEFKDGVENKFTKHLERYGFKDKFIALCERVGKSLCIRGESYGPGIQNMKLNPHSKGEAGLALFDVFIIDEHEYAKMGHELSVWNVAEEIGIPHVPILENYVLLTPELIVKYSIGMKKLPNGDHFEGVVIKHPTGSFKVINKHYDANK